MAENYISDDQWSVFLETREKRNENYEEPKGLYNIPSSMEDWNFESLVDVHGLRAPEMVTTRSTQSVKGTLPNAVQHVPSRLLVSSTPVVQPHSSKNHVNRISAVKNPVNDGQDLAAIKDTCLYVEKIVGNFNQHVENMPADVQQMVFNLNKNLSNIIPNKSSNSYENAGSSDCESNDQVHCVRFCDDHKRSNIIPNKNERCDIVPLQRNAPTKFISRSRATLNDVPPFSSLQSSHPKVHATQSPPQYTQTLHQESPPPLQVPSVPVSLPDSNNFSVYDMMQIFKRLDTRTVPKPEKFDLNSGQSVSAFLNIFEEYCENTFRGSPNLWIGELGRFLSGEIKVALEAIKTPGDTYTSLKNKLTRWVDNKSELLKNDGKTRFRNASMNAGESFSLYAARLENLFKAAYPNRTPDSNLTLRNKYFETVPDQFRTQLQNARTLTKTMTGAEMMWAQVISYASQFEIDNKTQYQEPNEVWLTQTPTPHQTNYRPSNVPVVVSRSDAYDPPTNQRMSREYFSKGRSGEKNENVVNKQYSSDRVQKENCTYCHKGNHLKKDCWRLLDLCLVCGSANHRISECPNRRYHGIEKSVQGATSNQILTDANTVPVGPRELVGCRSKVSNIMGNLN